MQSACQLGLDIARKDVSVPIDRPGRGGAALDEDTPRTLDEDMGTMPKLCSLT